MMYGLARKKKGDWWTLVSGRWDRENRWITFCGSCLRHYFDRLYPTPIDVRFQQLPRRRSIDWSDNGKVGVMRVDLMDRLRPYMPDFVFGRCLDASGSNIDSHVTFYTVPRIFVRSGTQSRFEPCPKCNWPVYLNRGRTPDYTLRRYLRADRHVYLDDISATFVSEVVAQTVDWTPFRDVELYEVPIRDTPLDGLVLPGDPPEWAHLAERSDR